MDSTRRIWVKKMMKVLIEKIKIIITNLISVGIIGFMFWFLLTN